MQQTQGISAAPTVEGISSLEKIEQGKHFINQFCDELQEYVTNEFNYVNFDREQIHARGIFLEQMKEGVASIEDNPDKCRGVCVSIQAGIERLLKLKLEKKELTKLDVLFLTGLPCTPLRKDLQKVDPTKEIDWKKWTVDIRTQTVREIRDSGAAIKVSFCQAQYLALAETNKSEFETYAREKEQPNTQDIPLSAPIPPDLIGALYTFTDKEGITYKLATQGIQFQHHGETPKELWKKWFGVAGAGFEIDKRSGEMEAFVNQNQR